ncbi:hypothetical protein ES695_13995 [Candidatus Atribacteria bacterium 1244-E10-H5-B2]|nr:MAG: hypothetical protein ES695_13995 [Candidatus Atribacteria bacterium 1244-E10-H5-B2]
MFGNKEEKEKELGIKINTWWYSLKYLQKLGIVLELYPKLDVTSIELQGLNNLWRTAESLEKKELVMETYEKEHKKERR